MTDEISLDEKREEAEREVKFRKRVYGRKVAEGKMRNSEADRRIAVMQAIAEDYRARTDLFG